MADEVEMRALIEEGSAYFNNKRYKLALGQYTRAMKRCPCYKGSDRQRCSCKDYDKTLAEDGSFIEEVMKACQCPAHVHGKCQNELHIHALDSRAAVFEKMAEIERAKRDAEWILELAPQLPQGYLRLGSIMRRRKSNKMAWLILSAGIEATKKGSMSQHPRIKDLYTLRQPLHRHYSRQDIVQLPAEILHLIFRLLDFPSRLRCIAVSKTWRAIFTSAEFRWAWRKLEFPIRLSRSGTGITAGVLRNLLGFSGNDAREITIPDAVRFQLNSKKFNMILRGARNLERLDIQQQIEPLSVDNPLIKLPKLAHLTVEMQRMNQDMLLFASTALTYLHLIDPIHNGSNIIELPTLLSLQYLRLTRRQSPHFMWICELSTQCPNIEQLLVENVPCPLFVPSPDETDMTGNIFPNIKVIIYRGTERRDVALIHHDLRRLLSLPGNSPIQYLEHDIWLGHSHVPTILPEPNSPPEEQQPYLFSTYDRLRVLRTSSVLEHPWGERLLKGAVDNGVLSSLCLTFPPPLFDEPVWQSSFHHLAGWDWLRGASCIKDLGFIDFDFGDERCISCPLPQFIKTFPNIETVEFLSDHHTSEYIACVAYDLLKDVKTLKKLYVNIMGEALYKLQAEAASRGVEFSRRRRLENSACTWPVPLEPDEMLRAVQP